MQSPFVKDESNKLPIESIIYSNFIRYDKLKEMTLYQYQSSDADVLNVYIDMYSIIKPLYKRVIIGDASLYTSLILNLCAHIRAYYHTRHSVSTNIYIVYTDNTRRMTNENYESAPLPNRHRDEVIEWNISILKTIVPYFPNLYFIQGNVESAILIKNYIDMHINPFPNMIITKDLLSWQIPSLDSNTCIFRPSKSRTDDTSFVINQSNCIYQWVSRVNTSKIQLNPLLSPNLLSLYIALTNYKEKMLNTYFSPKDALSRINGFINSSQILNGYNNPEVIKDLLYSISTKIEHIDLYTRYKSIDLQYITNIYKTYPVSYDMSWNFSKVDNETIKEINDKYFIKNPIDIIRLFQN